MISPRAEYVLELSELYSAYIIYTVLYIHMVNIILIGHRNINFN